MSLKQYSTISVLDEHIESQDDVMQLQVDVQHREYQHSLGCAGLLTSCGDSFVPCADSEEP